METNGIRTIRELRGAPLPVLLALSTTQQPVTQTWLCGVTGYTGKTIAGALRYLRSIGAVRHEYLGWSLDAGSAPLLASLGIDIAQIAGRFVSAEMGAEDTQNQPQNDNRIKPVASRRKNSASTTTIINTDSNTRESSSRVGKIPCVSDKNSPNNPQTKPPQDNYRALVPVISRLARYGIGYNQRVARLAAQPYMTPEYIDAHAAALRAAGKDKMPGLLIINLETGELPPAAVDKTDPRSYTTGEFAEYIS